MSSTFGAIHYVLPGWLCTLACLPNQGLQTTVRGDRHDRFCHTQGGESA